jgi:hypothetical protein
MPSVRAFGPFFGASIGENRVLRVGAKMYVIPYMERSIYSPRAFQRAIVRQRTRIAENRFFLLTVDRFWLSEIVVYAILMPI